MTVSEGGIRTPMLMAGPGVKGDRQVNAFCYVTEIMPTLLELTGVKKPDTYNGERVAPMRGRSLVKVLTGTSDSIYHDDEAIARELGFGMWIRRGDYKAACVPQG